MNDPITKIDIDAENWDECLKYPLCVVECDKGHVFHAHSKFSGRLVAIVSRTPCPVCGSYQLGRVSSGRESQTITKTGDLDV